MRACVRACVRARMEEAGRRRARCECCCADCAERTRLEGFTLEDATDLTTSARRPIAEPLSLSFMPLADTPSGLFRLHKRVRRAYGSFSDVARMMAALASRHDYSEIISDEGTRR